MMIITFDIFQSCNSNEDVVFFEKITNFIVWLSLVKEESNNEIKREE